MNCSYCRRLELISCSRLVRSKLAETLLVLTRGSVVQSVLQLVQHSCSVCKIISRGSRALPSTEPAFFISVRSFLVSLALILQPHQMPADKALLFITDVWKIYSVLLRTRRASSEASSRSRVCIMSAYKHPQCFISTAVCFPGEEPGICRPPSHPLCLFVFYPRWK